MRSNKCVICRHPKRLTIEAALRGGLPPEDLIIQIHGTSLSAIRRHILECPKLQTSPPYDEDTTTLATIPAPIVAKQPPPPVKDDLDGLSVRERLERLVAKAHSLLDNALDGVDGSTRDRAALIRACLAVLETMARLTGELGPEREIAILERPEWRRIEVAIARALAKHPAAAADVASELAALDARP